MIELISSNNDKLYYIDFRNGYSDLYMIFNLQITKITSFKGKISFLYATEFYVFMGLDIDYSRYYYKIYSYSIIKKELSKLFDSNEKKYNEFLVSYFENGNLYLTINKNDRYNNSIVKTNINTSEEKEILRKNKHLLYLMDVSESEAMLLVFEGIDNSHSILYLYNISNGKELVIRDEKDDCDNHSALFIEDYIVYITNYESNNYYIRFFSTIDKTEKIFTIEKEDIVNFICIKNTMFIVTFIGFQNKLYKKSNDYVEEIQLPQGITIIKNIERFGDNIVIIASGLNIGNSIYLLRNSKWISLCIKKLNEFTFKWENFYIKLNSSQHMEIVHFIGSKSKAVIWLHGGPNDSYKLESNALINFFLKKGFHVIVPNYRGSLGYGKEFSNCIHNRRTEYICDDCLKTINIAMGRIMDLSEIYICGESYGGEISYRFSLLESDILKGCISLFSRVDFGDEVNDVPEYLKGVSKKFQEQTLNLTESDVIEWYSKKIKNNVLVIEGELDLLNQSDLHKKIKDKLIDKQKIYSHYIVKNCNHGCSNVKQIKEVLGIIDRFLCSMEE